MAAVSVRKLAILALLNAPDPRGRVSQPVVGITRLQKLLFLVFKRLGRVAPTRELQVDFAYEPEKFGPADLELYADLDFLQAIGHIERRPSAAELLQSSASSQPAPEDLLETELSFDYLMGNEADAFELDVAERPEERFVITELGREAMSRIVSGLSGRDLQVAKTVLDKSAEIRREFGDWPLPRLLRYVYTTYPEMTTASRIRDRVLGYRR